MSLKAVHILFIVICIALCFGFAAWAFLGETANIPGNMRLLGGIGALCGVGLGVYGFLFLRKLKKLPH